MIHQWRLGPQDKSPSVSGRLWGCWWVWKAFCHTHKKPNVPLVNAVNGLLSSSILTFQYPNIRSSEENHWDPCKLSSVSSIWGNKYASLMVQLFSFLRSTQNLRLLSFFWTRTTALAHGLCNYQMTPISSIYWIWALTSSYMWGGIHQ